MSFHCPNQYRVRWGLMASPDSWGNTGSFLLPATGQSRELSIIASDDLGWEHVSVKAHEGKKTRIPTWAEMCRVKDVFWDGEDVVMQIHPRASEYVNAHPNVLHLWRPTTPGVTIPEPAWYLVGTKNGRTVPSLEALYGPAPTD